MKSIGDFISESIADYKPGYNKGYFWGARCASSSKEELDKPGVFTLSVDGLMDMSTFDKSDDKTKNLAALCYGNCCRSFELPSHIKSTITTSNSHNGYKRVLNPAVLYYYIKTHGHTHCMFTTQYDDEIRGLLLHQGINKNEIDKFLEDNDKINEIFWKNR